ncbi:MAG: dihydropteroate synthase, partial [Candidatus Omnitrophica bacterium]|nr:dihydropteroate synthase [Candidatus Omnitrophota bacterium]
MILRAREHVLSFERTFIMGVVNVTPDSFSDGGRYFSFDHAVDRARFLANSGADIIDIGGESSRPGAEPVSGEEEIRRVVPVIGCVTKEFKVTVSVDTTKSAVARAALECGASIVNDISGLHEDHRVAEVVARFNAGLILMHRRGNAKTMQQLTEYRDLIGDIIKELRESIDIAVKSGVPFENIAVDPGIGFSKTAEQNLLILKNLGRFRELGRPVLVGTSRKSFIGKTLGREIGERLFGTAATVALAVAQGAN